MKTETFDVNQSVRKSKKRSWRRNKTGFRIGESRQPLLAKTNFSSGIESKKVLRDLTVSFLKKIVQKKNNRIPPFICPLSSVLKMKQISCKLLFRAEHVLIYILSFLETCIYLVDYLHVITWIFFFFLHLLFVPMKLNIPKNLNSTFRLRFLQ